MNAKHIATNNIIRLTLLNLALTLSGITSSAAEIWTQWAHQDSSGVRHVGEESETNAPAVVLSEDTASLFLNTTAGISAYADQEGSMTGFCRTGLGPIDFGAADMINNFILLTWEQTFTKLDDHSPFVVIVGPWVLYLNDGSSLDIPDLSAFFDIDIQVNGVTQVSKYAGIQGRGDTTVPDTFHVYSEGGSLPDGSLEKLVYELTILGGPPVIRTYGALFTQPKHTTTLDLSDIEVGESFTVHYSILMDAIGYRNETMAAVDTRNPEQPDSTALDFSIMVKYGDFGGPVTIQPPQPQPDGSMWIPIDCKPDHYYTLLRQDGLDGLPLPVAMMLGENGAGGNCVLVDSDPPADSGRGIFYSVMAGHVSTSFDTDSDGILDVDELQRPDLLDPLDFSDALEDPDGDGRNNLRELLDGTDPSVADEAPAGPDDLYPARIHDLGNYGEMDTADLNNDGFADFVSFGNQTLESVLGEPNERFLPAIESPLSVSGWFTDLHLVKLDGDEFMDAVAINSSSYSAIILLGQGDGSFREHLTYTAGTGAKQVTSGDFNNDQVTDLVIMNENAKSLTLLTGNGDGSFSTNLALNLDFRPTHAVLAHLDSDTHADLAVTLTSSQVAILAGNGDGTFGTPTYIPTGFSPIWVVADDLDQDTHRDLVIANASSDDISIYHGNGDGTFGAETRIATGDGPKEIGILDLNDDTHLDVVVAHGNSDYHAILLNDGNGAFPAVVDKAFTGSPENLLLADTNLDGLKDLITHVGQGHIISHGLPGGQFDTRSEVIIPWMSPVDFEVVDINDDGWLDLLVANQQSNTVEILLGQANGSFQAQSPLLVGEKMAGLAYTIFDTGASVVTLAVVTQQPDWSPGAATNSLQVLLGDGNGGFTVQQAFELTNKPSAVIATDLDGDQLEDLLVVFRLTGDVQPFLANGDGTFTGGALQNLGEFITDLKTEDVNQDGRTDVIAINYAAGVYAVTVYHADASGALVVAQTITPAGYPSDLALGQMNNDTLVDVLVTDHTGTQIHHGVAGGTLDAGQPLVDVALTGDIEVADVSGDGIPDLVSKGDIQRGNATGGFDAMESYWPGSTSLPTTLVDLNGDGLLDILGAGDFADALFMLMHR